MKINTVTPFGDVDYGPSAGIFVAAALDEGETPESVWDYYTRNYQDDWQEWRLVGTVGDVVTMELFTRWGDHHNSVMP